MYNGLTEAWHPTQMLADLLTMREHSSKPLADIAYAYLGDARYNMGNSLLMAGALMGMDVRIIAPPALQPAAEHIAQARRLAEKSGARLTISDDPQHVAGVDYLHTDAGVDGRRQKPMGSAHNNNCCRTALTPRARRLQQPGSKNHALPARLP